MSLCANPFGPPNPAPMATKLWDVRNNPFQPPSQPTRPSYSGMMENGSVSTTSSGREKMPISAQECVDYGLEPEHYEQCLREGKMPKRKQIETLLNWLPDEIQNTFSNLIETHFDEAYTKADKLLFELKGEELNSYLSKLTGGANETPDSYLSKLTGRNLTTRPQKQDCQSYINPNSSDGVSDMLVYHHTPWVFEEDDQEYYTANVTKVQEYEQWPQSPPKTRFVFLYSTPTYQPQKISYEIEQLENEIEQLESRIAESEIERLPTRYGRRGGTFSNERGTFSNE